MVPYTIERNHVSGEYEVGTRYMGLWHPVASFQRRGDAEHWAAVCNGVATIVYKDKRKDALL